MQAELLPLPRDARWRRLISVVLFLALLHVFRHLAPVLVCFVILERSMAWCAHELGRRTNISPRASLGATLGATLVVVGGVAVYGTEKLIHVVHVLRAGGHEFWEGVLNHPSVHEFRHLLGVEGNDTFGEKVKEHAMEAMHYATATAHTLLYLVIGLILAIIFLFEHKEVEHWYASLEPRSIGGTLARWMVYVADAIVITVRMQGVVAAFNAVFTLPVLLALRLPNAALLFLLILVTGLLPVVGNFIAGAVLCLVAYQAHGAWAVGVFLFVTFVLHKVESYYLNPRLAAKHVKLPGLVLVFSLLLFEQLFGFVGLFLSFPALYVAMRIRAEWLREEGLAPPATEAQEAGDAPAPGAPAA